jgi:hypothetical protein
MTPATLRIQDVLHDRILISRESARQLAEAMKSALERATPPAGPEGEMTMIVDFAGIDGVSPSFVDELVSVFESLIGPTHGGHPRSLVVASPPTRLSSKFEAIARGHGMAIRTNPDGSWCLTGAPRSDR